MRFVLISKTFVILVSIYYLCFLSLTAQALPQPQPVALAVVYCACIWSWLGWHGPGCAGLLLRGGSARVTLSPLLWLAHIAWEMLIAALGKLQAPAPWGDKHGVRHRAAMGVIPPQSRREASLSGFGLVMGSGVTTQSSCWRAGTWGTVLLLASFLSSFLSPSLHPSIHP